MRSEPKDERHLNRGQTTKEHWGKPREAAAHVIVVERRVEVGAFVSLFEPESPDHTSPNLFKRKNQHARFRFTAIKGRNKHDVQRGG